VEQALVQVTRIDGYSSGSARSGTDGGITLRCSETMRHRIVVQRTEPDPHRPEGRRVHPPDVIDLELEWVCDPSQELVLKLPDRPR
jgi:hypothetical protein